jgi:putative ABC transport system permease protein
MRSLWAAALLLRRLRAEWGIVLLIATLVASTSFVFAVTPRIVSRAADAALHDDLVRAPASQRQVSIRSAGRIAPGSAGGVTGVRTFGERIGGRFPPSLTALIEEQLLRVTSLRLTIPEPPSYETHLSLRYQDGLQGATRLVAGRWPGDLGRPLQPAQFPGEDPPAPRPPAVVEIAFAAAQAAELGVELGDQLRVVSDGGDPFVRGSGARIMPAIVEVVGLFEPLDPDGEYWAVDRELLAADQVGSDDNPVANATAYVAAEAYPSLAAGGQPFHYEWTFAIDPERLDAGRVAQLQRDLPRLDRIGGTPPPEAIGEVVVRSGLLALLDRYAAQRALAESALSIAVLGPFGLAAAALATVAVLLVRRRAAALALARGRGASATLVLGTQLWESVLVAGGAAVLGLGLAVLAVPARSNQPSVVAAIAVAITAVLLLVGASWRAARQPLGRAEREDAAVVRVPARRLVIEMTVVGLAVAATVLLQQRGLSLEWADGLPRADPLLASVPVLSGLAAGIVAVRLYPLPIRFLAWLAARGRGLVPAFGLRSIGRQSSVANLPLLALLLTAAFGAFGSVVASSLDRGQVDASYAEVGADFRLERIGSNAMTFLDPAAVPGIAAVAGGYVENAARFASTDRQRASIRIEAIDAPAYAAVTAGTSADPAWPAEFLADPAMGGAGTAAVGSPDNPIPAILSPRLPVATAELAPGDTFRMEVQGEAMTFRLVEQRATFPGFDERSPYAIVPFAWVRAGTERGHLPILRYWLRGGAGAREALATAIAGAQGSARIVSRHELYAGLRETPLGKLVVEGYALAVGVAAIYLGLTIVGALILSAARRTRDVAYLRTLGLSSIQGLALTVMEHAPPVLLAAGPGIALGVGVAVLCLPALGLGAFTGASDAISPAFDAPALGALGLGLIATVAVAVGAGTWLARRARLANALRIGDD